MEGPEHSEESASSIPSARQAAAHARFRLGKGEPKEDVLNWLHESGICAEEAGKIVAEAERSVQSTGIRTIVLGLGMALLGGLFALLGIQSSTSRAFSDLAELIFCCSVIIIAGTIVFFIGLTRYLRLKGPGRRDRIKP